MMTIKNLNPCHPAASQVSLDVMTCEPQSEKCVVSFICLCKQEAEYRGTCAVCWFEETPGSFIRASVNQNSQFTNLDTHMHMHTDLGTEWRNIRRGIKVYVSGNCRIVFVVLFYRVTVALGKN